MVFCTQRGLMRKLAVSTFAILYAVLVVAGSAGRSLSWARKEADTLSERVSHHHRSRPFPKIDRSDSHLLQIKLTETEYIVECLKKVSDVVPTLAERARVGRVSEMPLWRSSQPDSSRAPPSLI